ncbi:phosphatase PAP2 family protein [Sphingobacterium sp. NPDC055346]
MKSSLEPGMLFLRIFILFILHFNGNCCFCQQDSVLAQLNQVKRSSFSKLMLNEGLIAPIGFISYGVTSVKNPYLQKQNELIKDNLQSARPIRIRIDDFTQYAATGSYFAFDLMGIRAKHDFKSRLFVASVAHIIMGSSVNLLKKSVPIMRPDFSASNSFPSGHTATAFVGAELIWQEYSHQSAWYGIGAYTIAAGTGFFRMYNNRHWLSDVVMGAGIGILSTKMAYWMLPKLEERIQKRKHPYLLMPSYNGKQFMLSFASSL